MRVVLGILALLIVAALAGMAWLYSGAYPVAATRGHNAVTAWVLETAKRQSVRAHARGVPVPPLGDFGRVEEGARLFEAHCALCHGAPAIQRQPFASGMNPLPPNLADEVGHWTSAELHWIIRHGLRMTGMPAHGARLADDEIWSVVAFLNQLPTMDPERYRAIVTPDLPFPEERPGEETPAADDAPSDGDEMVPPAEEGEDEGTDGEPGDPPQPQLQPQTGAAPRPMRLMPD